MEAIPSAVDAQMEASHSGEFRPTHAVPCPVMRERGVYVADWYYKGTPIVYSINSRHEVLDWVHWYPGHDYATIERGLWMHLDAADPVGPTPRS